jgi:hypothetical protein
VTHFEAVGITRKNLRYAFHNGSEQKANMLFCLHASPLVPRNDPRHGRGLAHRRRHGGYPVRGRGQGLAAIRGNEWVAGIAQGLNVVKVSVAEIRVEHEVKLMDFTKWLERAGGWPREVSDRQHIRSILGIPVSR